MNVCVWPLLSFTTIAGNEKVITVWHMTYTSRAPQIRHQKHYWECPCSAGGTKFCKRHTQPFYHCFASGRSSEGLLILTTSLDAELNTRLAISLRSEQDINYPIVTTNIAPVTASNMDDLHKFSSMHDRVY